MCIGGSCYYTLNRYGHIDPDERDKAHIAECEALLNARDGIRVGDFIRFADGVTMRVIVLEKDEDGKPWLIQPTPGGSFHLGKYGCSASGSCYQSVAWETLTRRQGAEHESHGCHYGTQLGTIWVSHHNDPGAGHATYDHIRFRVFDCSENSPAH